MKLPEVPRQTLNDQLKSVHQQAEIKKAIEAQSKELVSELKAGNDISKKQLNNQPIIIEEINDFKVAVKDDNAKTSKEAKFARWISLVALAVAIASLVVAIVK